MTVRIFTISHDRQGLAEVERVSGHLPGLTARLRAQAGSWGASCSARATA
ncbi:hypothetical protein G7085_01745 [Tessaracoccus sp. HDW20]|nr:hypothetical protein [Tessaracoccus coleopterorum]NHB83839.1 hypothetical protein [Tessaracoccus coleopterorum]